MKIIFYLVHFILNFIVVKCDDELVMLIEIFRHGSRNPAKQFKQFQIYPDPYLGPSDLTPVGYRQHYLLGKAIRKKYGDFLPEKYTYQNVDVYASNKNRTLASAMSQVMGIFDLGKGQQVESEDKNYFNPPIDGFDILYPKEYGQDALPFAPTMIPIKSPADEKNTIFDGLFDCPKLKDSIQNSAQDLRNKYNSTFGDLYTELEKNNYHAKDFGGEEHYEYKIAEQACDYILSRVWQDETFQVDEVLIDRCEYLFYIGEIFFFLNEQERQTSNTGIMQIIKNKLEQKRDDKLDDLKLLMFSSHDLNLRSFMQQFFKYNLECSINEYKNKYQNQQKLQEKQCITKIKFTSQIMIEMYKNQANEFYVKLIFNNTPMNIFQDNQSNQDTLETFLKMLDDSIDENFDENCGNFWVPNDESIGNFYLIGWIIAIIVLCVLMFLYFQKRNENLNRETQQFENTENLIN